MLMEQWNRTIICLWVNMTGKSYDLLLLIMLEIFTFGTNHFEKTCQFIANINNPLQHIQLHDLWPCYIWLVTEYKQFRDIFNWLVSQWARYMMADKANQVSFVKINICPMNHLCKLTFCPNTYSSKTFLLQYVFYPSASKNHLSKYILSKFFIFQRHICPTIPILKRPNAIKSQNFSPRFNKKIMTRQTFF